ncbi:helix-hairpin-helix domain-containing protein [Enterobacteriaceae bacterium H18W14]|uniref:ComEA family DNA-binding protein n=1 Tax=Dryocola boscaweniae TaxID=2925397 RepID=UPI0022F06747|nr:helix-hairpin-helix domain-containing protein [Dryocola boscaweniae]MCT4713737.1 helix-hairpin-helix domain-containing protein [Dryocola boscaweniae]
MKSGMKSFYLALTLIGASACSPAYAVPATAKNEATAQLSTPAENGAAKAPALKAADPKTVDVNDGVVSINTASAEELARVINGVGLKKAQSIVSYREEYGPFKELDQLQEVPGIGSALVERNRAHLKL